MFKRISTLLVIVASLTLATSASACEGEQHQAMASHHQISLVPQAHAHETAPGIKTSAFQVKGMMCSSCYDKVSGALNKLPGVKTVGIEKKKNIVTVTYAVGETNTDAMLKAVDSVGFKAKTN